MAEEAKEYVVTLLLTQKEVDTIMFQDDIVSKFAELPPEQTPPWRERFEEMVNTIIEDWCHKRTNRK